MLMGMWAKNGGMNQRVERIKTGMIFQDIFYHFLCIDDYYFSCCNVPVGCIFWPLESFVGDEWRGDAVVPSSVTSFRVNWWSKRLVMSQLVPPFFSHTGQMIFLLLCIRTANPSLHPLFLFLSALIPVSFSSLPSWWSPSSPSLSSGQLFGWQKEERSAMLTLTSSEVESYTLFIYTVHAPSSNKQNKENESTRKVFGRSKKREELPK